MPSEPVRTESLGRMAAGIAHDLNGVLAGISATAEMLARAPGRDAEALRAIVAHSGRASQLIRQLMAFARAEQLAPEALDLGDVVRELAPTLIATLGAAVPLDLALAPAGTVADRLAIERCVVNLVANARNALGAAGHVRIETHMILAAQCPLDAHFMRRMPYAVLAVSDDGPGVPHGLSAKLFEPYFTTRPDGHGLGLSTAFGLVKQMGGYLLHDRGPLGGARFRIFLPRA